MPFKINKNIILASGSPRRQKFLKDLGLDFSIKLKETDESYPKHLRAEEIAIFISEKKAAEFTEIKNNEVVITSDTIVWHNNKALGKPRNRVEAIEMLNQLSDDHHEVITAISLKTANTLVNDYEVTKVYFNKLTSEEIEYYVDNFKPFDKAGSYGIQEWIGLIGISKIEGSYNNVVGLPVDKLYQHLKDISN